MGADQRRRRRAWLPTALGGMLVSACASDRIEVEAHGARPSGLKGPFELSELSDTQGPVVNLLRSRGLIAPAGQKTPIQVEVAARRRDRMVGICATPDSSAPGRCLRWIEAPSPPRGPFAKPVRYAVGLRFIDGSSGRVIYGLDARLNGRNTATPGNDERLADALVNCPACATR